MNYGPVWIDIDGTELLDTEIPLLQHPMTGGVLLFMNNYKSVAQLKALTKSIRDNAGKQILISVDHEGGRKWRFYEGFQKPDAPQDFGTLYRKEPDRALDHLRLAGQIVAHELLTCGVDITNAPVLDVDCGVSTIIGDRAYSDDPFIVTNCARAFIAGMRQQGMGSVGKHYPGHGGCVMDTHLATTIDARSFAEIEAKDLVPFAKLSDVLTAVMPAHVIYSSVDPNPAGFSDFWLRKILRDQIGFNGTVISDCLSMKGSGYSDNIVAGIERALHAGCDMVITSKQSRSGLLQILDSLNWQMSAAQQARIAALAGDFANPGLKTQPALMPELVAE